MAPVVCRPERHCALHEAEQTVDPPQGSEARNTITDQGLAIVQDARPSPWRAPRACKEWLRPGRMGTRTNDGAIWSGPCSDLVWTGGWP
jgi:hypothetical protein